MFPWGNLQKIRISTYCQNARCKVRGYTVASATYYLQWIVIEALRNGGDRVVERRTTSCPCLPFCVGGESPAATTQDTALLIRPPTKANRSLKVPTGKKVGSSGFAYFRVSWGLCPQTPGICRFRPMASRACLTCPLARTALGPTRRGIRCWEG